MFRPYLQSFVLLLLKLRSAFQALFHRYIYTGQYTSNRNFGDALGYWLPKLLHINSSHILPRRRVFSRQYHADFNLQMVGSTLGDITAQSIVCGAGAIEENQSIPASPFKVISVRGPLTRKLLLNQGIECPQVYGDPAMLLPSFYTPKKRDVRHPIGLIAHYVDQSSPSVQALMQDPRVHLIDILLPKNGMGELRIASDWKSWIDELCSCALIVSSSLHGLILADAYGIPSVWAKFSDDVIGDGFKFHDYYASISTPPHMFKLY